MTPAAIRARFPALSARIYLNAASEGPMPAEAVSRAEALARLKSTPWEIGMDYYYQVPASVRARLEGLIGAPKGSVGLAAGTSAGIGIAARGLPVAEGDEILLLEGQFPSNLHPWGAAVRRGAQVRVAPRPLGADPTEAVLAAIGPRTRIVSVDWVSFIDGAVVDLPALGAALRARDIRFVVDGAQGVGALQIDFATTGADVLAAPSHKWLLGPVGCGFLAVRPERLDMIQSWNSGWVNLAMSGGFRNILQGDGAPPPDATRFETGSPAYSLLAPWGESLDLLAGIGPATVERHVTALAVRIVEGVLALAPAQGRERGLRLVSPSPPARRSGIVSFGASGEETIALYRALAGAGITVALREGSIRVAPHVYNTEDEIDALLSACRAFLG